MELFEDYPREYADQLMQAMDLWAQQNVQASTGEATSFSTWHKERKELNNNTISLSEPQTKNWDDKL